MSKKHLGCQKCNTPTQNGAPGISCPYPQWVEKRFAKKMPRALGAPPACALRGISIQGGTFMASRARKIETSSKARP